MLLGIEEWIEVAYRLPSPRGWAPSCLTTRLARNHDSVQERFPDDVAHFARELSPCCRAPRFEDYLNYPLDEPLFDASLPYERVAHQMMDCMEIITY